MPTDVEIETEIITVENAHRFFTKRQLRFIAKTIKENYKQGFLNGMSLSQNNESQVSNKKVNI